MRRPKLREIKVYWLRGIAYVEGIPKDVAVTVLDYENYGDSDEHGNPCSLQRFSAAGRER